MFNENTYDLSRMKYHEYNAQLNALYEPLRETRVSLAHRLAAWVAAAMSRTRRPAAKPARAHAVGAK